PHAASAAAVLLGIARADREPVATRPPPPLARLAARGVDRPPRGGGHDLARGRSDRRVPRAPGGTGGAAPRQEAARAADPQRVADAALSRLLPRGADSGRRFRALK